MGNKPSKNNPHGTWKRPVFWVNMGGPDLGKSLDVGLTFGARSLFFGDPRGFRMLGEHGVVLDRRPYPEGQIVPSRDMSNAIKVMRRERKINKGVPFHKRRFLAYVWDDWTRTWVEESARWIAQYPKGSKDWGMAWSELTRVAKTVVKLQSTSGVHGLAAMQYVDPKDDDTRGFVRGEIDMPGQKLSKIITHEVDVVAHWSCDSDRWPWPVSINHPMGPSDENMIKDRHNLLRGNRPACTRELMHHAGYWMPPIASGLEWVEDVVEAVAQDLAGGKQKPKAYRKVYRRYFETLAEDQGVPDPIVYRAFFRGLCRNELRSPKKRSFYAALLHNTDLL